MKAAAAPSKLRFTVLSCTSEDGDHPACELLYHSPETKGWQTPRFCSYPQDLVLKLEQPSRVRQIQVLSHEFKITSQLELYVASSGPTDPSAASVGPLQRLGYLSFDTNDKSNYQARELKSAFVDTSWVSLVKLSLHHCHVNKLNIYSQVGLIAINLIGEPEQPPLAAPPDGYLQLHPPVAAATTYYNAAAADVADVNLDLHVDTETAAKIRHLAALKDAAVEREDYDSAKSIKAAIDRLKVVGQKIAQLEQRKRAAVEKEDYETAKLIKGDVDKLRAAGDLAAGALHPLRKST